MLDSIYHMLSLSSAEFFLKDFSQNCSRNIFRMSNCLDPDKDISNLGLTSLQIISAGGISRL